MGSVVQRLGRVSYKHATKVRLFPDPPACFFSSIALSYTPIMTVESGTSTESNHLSWVTQLSEKYGLRVVQPYEVTQVCGWLIKEKPRTPEYIDYDTPHSTIMFQKASALAIVSEVNNELNSGMLLQMMNPDLWYISWIYVRPDLQKNHLGQATMYFGMIQAYFRRANTFLWDTPTVVEYYNGAVGFHTRVAGSGPDLIKPGYFDNSPDCNGAIWIRGMHEVDPQIEKFLMKG